MEVLIGVLNQIPQIFLHPMLYVGVLIIVLQYRRQITLERKLFSSRIHSLPKEVLSSLGYGLLGGIITSSLMIVLGIVLHPSDTLLIWVITIVLILFNVRFLCLSYATGIIGVVAGVFQLFDLSKIQFFNNPAFSWTTPILEGINQIQIPSIIAIVAILHLVEAILIRLQASKQATPLFLETKRGKLVGGHHIQSYWLLPLFLVVSTGNIDAGIQLDFSWWPLIGSGVGLTILPVPAMIGYSDLTSVNSPSEKSKKTSNYLLLYSLVLLGMAFIAEKWVAFQIVAAFFAGFAHEIILFFGKQKEKTMPPIYVHPKDGLKVLAVLPDSIAMRMGIKPGEVIKKVNGVPVTSIEELYYALQRQSAFVKLEVINLEGHLKFTQHSIYDGDHYQLGIILAPDDNAPYYIEVENTSLLELLKQKIHKTSHSA
ncbi:hypothetical protein BHF71_06275 [Vulcanibacillus modesticaldus]|uniref:PDZ domain-containing protein n=1 Tax=Vulcanibacillus modesticaldus TaxID=337097 RepID=A0A1D2YWY6_9BACI|nr:PDZ domain-containing protein [Vulcanibacillus modesticaldus]OEG00127.1 hypothetical protein BHF71_06275 [Vulcanibacillus modesticaldus]